MPPKKKVPEGEMTSPELRPGGKLLNLDNQKRRKKDRLK